MCREIQDVNIIVKGIDSHTRPVLVPRVLEDTGVQPYSKFKHVILEQFSRHVCCKIPEFKAILKGIMSYSTSSRAKCMGQIRDFNIIVK